jgi:hypothetical protein
VEAEFPRSQRNRKSNLSAESSAAVTFRRRPSKSAWRYASHQRRGEASISDSRRGVMWKILCFVRHLRVQWERQMMSFSEQQCHRRLTAPARQVLWTSSIPIDRTSVSGRISIAQSKRQGSSRGLLQALGSPPLFLGLETLGLRYPLGLQARQGFFLFNPHRPGQFT